MRYHPRQNYLLMKADSAGFGRFFDIFALDPGDESSQVVK